jgi:hypothetical protein
MTEATSTSETSVNFYQTTRRNNPEDSHLHTRRLENMKSHSVSRSPYLYLMCVEVNTAKAEELFFSSWLYSL